MAVQKRAGSDNIPCKLKASERAAVAHAVSDWMSLHQPSRALRGPMGTRAYWGEDEGVRLGAARSSRADRVSGMDRG